MRKSYRELVEAYQQRSRAALVDGITVALSHADEVVMDLNLLEETGLLSEILGTVSVGLPFAVIAVTEHSAVIRGRKTGKAALQDASFRMLKTGAGLAAGSAVMASGLGAIPAIPVAVGVRAMLEKYRSSLLTARRVRQRIQRLEALSEARKNRVFPAPEGTRQQAIAP